MLFSLFLVVCTMQQPEICDSYNAEVYYSQEDCVKNARGVILANITDDKFVLEAECRLFVK